MIRVHRAAVLVACTAVLTSSCGLRLQNIPFDALVQGPSKQITAVFADAGRLPVGGKVRIGQADVGRVAAIDTRDFKAVVRMDIDSEIPLPVGTAARLELTSPLSEEFVMLEPPAHPRAAMLADGAVIPLEDTTRGPEVENLLAAVGGLLNGSGIDQARTVVTELNTALAGREHKVRDLLGQLEKVLTVLDQHSHEITRVIDSMHAMSGQLARNRPVLESAFTEIRPAMATLLAERERFTRLLGNTAALSTAADQLVSQTDDMLIKQIRQLRPMLIDLRSFGDHLGGTLASLQRFSKLFQQSTPGDYVLFNGTLDVPGSIAELLKPGAPPPTFGDVGEMLEGGTR